jgi:hypothetical protein
VGTPEMGVNSTQYSGTHIASAVVALVRSVCIHRLKAVTQEDPFIRLIRAKSE